MFEIAEPRGRIRPQRLGIVNLPCPVEVICNGSEYSQGHSRQ